MSNLPTADWLTLHQKCPYIFTAKKMQKWEDWGMDDIEFNQGCHRLFCSASCDVVSLSGMGPS